MQKIGEKLQKLAEEHAVERFRTTRDKLLAEKCKWSYIAGATTILKEIEEAYKKGGVIEAMKIIRELKGDKQII